MTYVHSNGATSSMTEEEWEAIPQYRCEKCGDLFHTTTDRRICGKCMRRVVGDRLFAS